jgi:parallel beta-helix repeat protein
MWKVQFNKEKIVVLGVFFLFLASTIGIGFSTDRDSANITRSHTGIEENEIPEALDVPSNAKKPHIVPPQLPQAPKLSKLNYDYGSSEVPMNRGSRELTMHEETAPQLADLAIPSFETSRNIVHEGDSVEFSLGIDNVGLRFVKNTEISLYDNEMEETAKITTLDVDFAGFSTEMIAFSWQASTTGTHTIHAAVDPMNNIKENEEDNNQHSTSIEVVPQGSIISNNIDLIISPEDIEIGDPYLTSNNISDNHIGIHLRYEDFPIRSDISRFSNVTNNIFQNNTGSGVSLLIKPITPNMIINTTISHNNITPIGYGINASVYSESNTIIKYNNVIGGYIGIKASGYSDICIYRNDIRNTTNSGIYLGGGLASLPLKVNENTINNTNFGIHYQHAATADITNNTITNNSAGIYGLFYCSNITTIYNNSIKWNYYGIRLYAVESAHVSTIIHHNDFTSNAYGIYLNQSTDNQIHHNNFYSNTVNQAVDDGANNLWNNTYPSGGNYWDDYSPFCGDLYNGSATPQTSGSPDGICDWPHNITGSAGSKDYYPLVDPA